MHCERGNPDKATVKPLAHSVMAALLLFLLVLLAPFSVAHAGTGVTLVEGKDAYPLGHHLAYLEDKTGNLTLEDVRSEAYDGHFTASTSKSLNFGFTKSTYWFRLDIHNQDSPVSYWLLENQYPLLDYVDAYLIHPGSLPVEKRSGDRLPFSQREVKHQHVMFGVPLSKGQSVRVYIRVSTESSMQMQKAQLLNTKGLQVRDHEERFFSGIYYGIVIAMLLFNLMIFLSIRDITYLYYVQYIFGWILFQMSLGGLAYEYLWPDFPDLGNSAHPFFIGFSYFAVLQFSRHFLKLKENLPRLDKFLLVLVAMSVLQMTASCFASYTIAIKMGTLCAMTGTVLVFATGVIAWRRGIRQAKYFMLAWSVLLASILVYALKTFGILPTVFITEYGLQIGSSLEVVLLSFALAHRMRLLKEENARIQKNSTEMLEQRVRERTAELDRTLARLEEANEKLTSLSYTDGLTGVKNRAYFDKLFEVEWRRAQRAREPLSALILDIDHFKDVNDKYGHLVGDICLKQVAECVRRIVSRAGDEVFRFGGEEFIVLLPSTAQEGAARLAELVRSQIEALAITVDDQHIRITVSIGIATLIPDENCDRESLIAKADAAMYEAKNAGRNRVCAYIDHEVGSQGQDAIDARTATDASANP